MARDRRRAKQRRDRAARQSPPGGGGASSRAHDDLRGREDVPPADVSAALDEAEEATHGAPPEGDLSAEELLTDEELAPDLTPEEVHGAGADSSDEDDDGLDAGDELLPAARGGGVEGMRSGAPIPKDGNRVLNFLRACAAELRRVQWPDRPQVVQATSVVLGFVVIAGAFLGLIDIAMQKLVDVIL